MGMAKFASHPFAMEMKVFITVEWDYWTLPSDLEHLKKSLIISMSRR